MFQMLSDASTGWPLAAPRGFENGFETDLDEINQTLIKKGEDEGFLLGQSVPVSPSYWTSPTIQPCRSSCLTCPRSCQCHDCNLISWAGKSPCTVRGLLDHQEKVTSCCLKRAIYLPPRSVDATAVCEYQDNSTLDPRSDSYLPTYVGDNKSFQCSRPHP